MNYSLATLRHEWQRFLPGILAVAFSALLIAMQVGLLLGLLSVTSIPIDRSRADLWIGSEAVESVDTGRPIPESYLSRLGDRPEVERVELFSLGFSQWGKPNGGNTLCVVVGADMRDDNLGAVTGLTPELREKLTLPGSVVLDASELNTLGVEADGGSKTPPKIFGHTVRVVGVIRGYKSMAGPFVFCSQSTARQFLNYQPGQVTYLLGKCHNPADAKAVAADLQAEFKKKGMSAFTSRDFSWQSRMHWLWKTNAGVALGFSAVLGLLVGSVVTVFTLYEATVASAREYAVLRALGIPRWRISSAVLALSCWVGLAGVPLGLLGTGALRELLALAGVQVIILPEVMAGTAALTLVMAAASGLIALRSLRAADPATLLR